MRKLLLLLFVALLASMPAAAEGDYWAFGDESFYHMLPECGGMNGRDSVSADGRYACAACAGEIKQYADGVHAVERGGTVVVRVTDAYAYSDALDAEDMYGWSAETITGTEAYGWLSRNFNGPELLNAAAWFFDEKPFKMIAREPYVFGRSSKNGEIVDMLNMSIRSMDGCRYLCVRAEDGRQIDSIELNLRISEAYISMKHGDLTYDWSNNSLDASNLSIEGGTKEEQLFFAEQTGLSVRIMKEMDTYICVVREHGADPALLREVELNIAGSYAPIQVSGYMDGDDGVYVTVISEGEYRAIADGATVSVRREAWYKNAVYFGEYGIAQKGTAGDCIIDQAHNVVIEPQEKVSYSWFGGFTNWFSEYDQNTRVTGIPAIRRWDTSEDYWQILNGETLEVMAEHRNSDYVIDVSALTMGVYRVNKYGQDEYRAMDGTLLFMQPNEETGYGGGYRHLQDGEPQRLVGYNGNHKNWLADLYGEMIVGTEYNSIVPLVWKDGKGVYLVANYEIPEDDWYDSYPRYTSQHGYGDTMAETDPESSWHCGLIDQNGKLLAPVEYTSFTMISENQAVLSNEDGSVTVGF